MTPQILDMMSYPITGTILVKNIFWERIFARINKQLTKKENDYGRTNSI